MGEVLGAEAGGSLGCDWELGGEGSCGTASRAMEGWLCGNVSCGDLILVHET